jgi:hypothetical protein
MGERKPILASQRLDRWSQIRRRGNEYLVCGRFERGQVFVIGVFDTLAEASSANIGWLQARERELVPTLVNPRLIYQQNGEEA